MKRVWREIANHTGSASPEATFMRLLRKQIEARFIAPVEAAIRSGRIRVDAEDWPLDELEPLWSRNTAGRPRFDEGPVVVLDVAGVRFLLDGHNRRRKRLDRRDRETQSVLRVRT